RARGARLVDAQVAASRKRKRLTTNRYMVERDTVLNEDAQETDDPGELFIREDASQSPIFAGDQEMEQWPASVGAIEEDQDGYGSNRSLRELSYMEKTSAVAEADVPGNENKGRDLNADAEKASFEDETSKNEGSLFSEGKALSPQNEDLQRTKPS
ncbi:unnamed protein product, partial [Amoebophrya sp. A25]